jgi:magnesium-dependent phosphatase 1
MTYKLIVFDLDFTLWNAGGTWCDHTYPPYRRVNGHIYDSENAVIHLYPDVIELLNTLHHDYMLAVASRTNQPGWANELLDLFGIKAYFNHLEIYPGSKTTHFNRLNNATGIPFSEMIFFILEVVPGKG